MGQKKAECVPPWTAAASTVRDYPAGLGAVADKTKQICAESS
jgi:hypothetical protein